ncbi:hypothetical protein [Algicella marina]|uniref:Sulfotransferase family protein n=1 Tax=Algicella marina TaxID=2683284 RepID=A0A6P1SZW3_9RHOB|nr:hypothetical protein [Algicella marina]QHQ35065.1 hypothetical protein GO499_07580 [Algicella marina]
MPRLILHIGIMKTGSSALQRFFARNRAVLPAFGLHYPKATAADGRPLEKHADIVEALQSEVATGSPHPRLGPARDVLERYLSRAERRRTTLLSAEGLAVHRYPGAQLFEGLQQRFDIRVVVFLRRQDEWALSTYREHVMRPDIAESRPFRDWVEAPEIQAQMDYDGLLTAWMRAVGEENIRVLRYPHELPLLPSFLKAADLPRALLSLPFHTARVKESVTDTVLLDQLVANGGVPQKPDLSQEERDQLLDTFQRSNYLAKNRFRPELGPLFAMD